MSLNELAIGQKGIVQAFTGDSGVHRRILDLGAIEGTLIEPLFKSPAGNPTAYAIRGAVIALRSDVSSAIQVLEC